MMINGDKERERGETKRVGWSPGPLQSQIPSGQNDSRNYYQLHVAINVPSH